MLEMGKGEGMVLEDDGPSREMIPGDGDSGGWWRPDIVGPVCGSERSIILEFGEEPKWRPVAL